MSDDLPENKPGDDVVPAVEITKIRVAATNGDEGPRLVFEFADDKTPPTIFRINFTEQECARFIDDIHQVVRVVFPRRRN